MQFYPEYSERSFGYEHVSPEISWDDAVLSCVSAGAIAKSCPQHEQQALSCLRRAYPSTMDSLPHDWSKGPHSSKGPHILNKDRHTNLAAVIDLPCITTSLMKCGCRALREI